MKVETFQCDVCGTQKKAANRWWKVGIIPAANTKLLTEIGMIVTPWEIVPEDRTAIASIAHLCGEQCLIQYISKNLFHSVTEPGAVATGSEAQL